MLPRALQTILESLAAPAPRGQLRSAREQLTHAYRDAATQPALLRRDDEALAYALARMPATFAAVRQCLGELGALDLPAPESLLDFGAGPGTATWAAAEAFPSLRQATWIELSAPMAAVGRRLLEGYPTLALDAHHAHPPSDLPAHDLAVAAYVLNELPTPAQATTLGWLWPRAGRALLVVEPGTPRGFAVVREARRWLAAQGAIIAAPCPHGYDCPMVEPSWCHFAARLPRTALHRRLKDASVGWEDEKYSYVLAVRQPFAGPRPARVLRAPHSGKAGIRLELCTAAGQIETVSVASRDRAAMARVRRLDWGDVTTFPDSPDGRGLPATPETTED